MKHKSVIETSIHKAQNAVLATLVGVVIFAGLLIIERTLYRVNIEHAVSQSNQAHSIDNNLMFADEVMSSSIALAAQSTDLSWRRRYERQSKVLDEEIASAETIADPKAYAIFTEQMGKMRAEISAIDARVLTLVDAGDTKSAQALLVSSDYTQTRARMTNSFAIFGRSLKEKAALEQSALNAVTYRYYGSFITISCVLIFILWRSLRTHLRQSRDIYLHSETKLKDLATKDTLTRLYNRYSFRRYLDTTKLGGGLLYLDLDGFKAINDQAGHDAGDEALKVVGTRLRTLLSDQDWGHGDQPALAARIGGDEFAIFIPGADRQSTLSAANEVVSVISETFAFRGKIRAVGASVGMTMVSAPVVSFDDIMREADSAMYTVKRNGKNGVAFFDDKQTQTPPGESDDPVLDIKDIDDTRLAG